jgi:uncharacterized protein YhfF
MQKTSQTDAFWQEYLAILPQDDPQRGLPYTLWDFADTPEAATKVGNLVRLGVKTSTSCLVWEMEQIGEPLPEVGELAVVVGGQGEPLCVIEVTEVIVKPFDAVDEQFAYEYGEGLRTLAGWRADSWEFWGRACERIGREPSGSMPLGCQRFRLLYPR